MTIANTVTSVQYTGNNAATQFAFNNKIFQATDLVVTLIDTLGNQYPFVNFTNIVLGLNYTVSNVDVDTGCTVVFNSPPALGWTIDIRTGTPDTQLTSIKNQGAFLPELHEEAFDKITREVQDLLRQTYTYGIHGPDLEATPWPALPIAANRKNLALIFDGSGLPTVGVPSAQTLTALQLGIFGNDSGIANAYVFTHLGPLAVSLTTGALARFVPLNPNTGPSTVNVDGTGVVAVVRANGTALSGGEFSSLGPVVLQYNGTAWQIVATAGAQPGYERQPGEILAGVTALTYTFLPFDLRRYGAKFDGATLDDAAWTRAIGVAVATILGTSTAGVRLQMPPGVSQISAQLTFPNGVSCSGPGTQSTMIRVASTFPALTATAADIANTGGAIRMGATAVIATLGAITGGAGYTNGTYTNVLLTGGSGVYARATITVAGGAVTGVTVTYGGQNYANTDVVSATAASIGGTGSGFSVPVATVSGVFCFGVQLEGFILELGSVSGATIGIGSTSINDEGIRNVIVNNFGSRGVQVIGGSFGGDGYTLDNVECFKVNAGGSGGYGFDLQNGTYPANVRIGQVVGHAANPLAGGYSLSNLNCSLLACNVDGSGANAATDGVLISTCPAVSVVGLVCNAAVNAVHITGVGTTVVSGMSCTNGTNAVLDAGGGGSVAKTITGISLPYYARGPVVPSIFEQLNLYGNALIAAAGNAGITLDKAGAIGTGRLQLFTSDGTSGLIADDAYLKGNNTNLHIQYLTALITGALGVNGNAAPAQVTGFGTPTGTGVIANFPGATATLAQCSQAIAELIKDLKAIGFYGT